MNDVFPHADLVIMALIAAFILLKLRSVLGQNMGHENPAFKLTEAKPAEPIVQVSEKAARAKQEAESEEEEAGKRYVAEPTSSGIEAIKAADREFSVAHFIRGAKAAFEMVFDAFAKGDKDVLKNLLSQPLYTVFAEEIDRRSSQERKNESTLVSVELQRIADASITMGVAKITVTFTSEQITVVRDKTGAIAEGDPSHIERVEDEWVFERDTTSRNPNWKIIET